MKHQNKKNTLNKLHQVGVFLVLCVLIVATVNLAGCSDDETSLDDRISALKLQTLPEIIYPEDNPTSPQKVELGRMLFWDPVISGERNISCATCHHPNLAYGDAIDVSIGPGGTGLGTGRIPGNDRPLSATLSIRNSTSIINAAYVGLTDASEVVDVNNAPLNWHVNRRSLEAQAFGPLASVPHMKGKATYDATSIGDSLVKRVKVIAEYVALFDQAFNKTNGVAVTKDNIGKAIANFERSVISNNSSYDKYVKGQKDAITDQQKRGLLLFFGKANCASCHKGPMFSDFGLYNLGIKHNTKLTAPDKGNSEKYLFRTPSLRNVALTAPYMHSGMTNTLKAVVEFYNKGESENPEINSADIAIKPLNLSETEMDDLVAFLEALTDDTFDKKIPASVPSGLKVGGI